MANSGYSAFKPVGNYILESKHDKKQRCYDRDFCCTVERPGLLTIPDDYTCWKVGPMWPFWSPIPTQFLRFNSFVTYSHEKPNQSYISLISEAILSSPEQKLILSDIYNFILTRYPYFRTKGTGWRNSIRHNLSLNECFVKAGRSPNGKGHFWAIDATYFDDFRRGDFRKRRSYRRYKSKISNRGRVDDAFEGKVELLKVDRECGDHKRDDISWDGYKRQAQDSTKQALLGYGDHKSDYIALGVNEGQVKTRTDEEEILLRNNVLTPRYKMQRVVSSTRQVIPIMIADKPKYDASTTPVMAKRKKSFDVESLLAP